jgi:hypothetical protein
MYGLASSYLYTAFFLFFSIADATYLYLFFSSLTYNFFCSFCLLCPLTTTQHIPYILFPHNLVSAIHILVTPGLPYFRLLFPSLLYLPPASVAMQYQI